mgnify:FL=1|jgi:hypothetical protein
MTKPTISCLTLLLFHVQFLYAQILEFEVSYDLTMHTAYQVDKEDRSRLLPQDTIKLQPTFKSEHITEHFYDNGQSTTTVQIHEPTPRLEHWLTPIDRVKVTENNIEVYHNEQLLYEETDMVDEPAITLPSEFASYYLATNNWSLPLTPDQENQYIDNGYSIHKNTSTTLQIGCDSMLLFYDKSNWTETQIKLNAAGVEYYRQIVSYVPNSEGFLLYKDIVTWTLDSRTDPCIQKVVYLRYDNIERIYHNQQLSPSLENGHMLARVPSQSIQSYTVTQVEGTNHVYVDFVSPNLRTVQMAIKDLYGIKVIDNISMDTSSPYIDLGELPTGVYSLHLDFPNSLPCKFIFRP